jgi:tripartite-type tricarboxylate transporter receptor subunit TctC
LLLLIVLCCSGAVAQTAAPSAADYPSHPIRLIVPFPVGGSTDVLARAIAPELSNRLGRPVLVDNRPGAAGVIGLDVVAKAAPDGYTIGLVSAGNMVIQIMLLASPPYDPAKDLAPIAFVADSPVVLVANASVPANNVKELIALDRADPGKLSFATAGNGTTQHLAGELFNSMAGTKLVHVPYKGTGPAVTDILGGQIQLGVIDLPPVAPHLKGGRIKLLAVGGNKRALGAPDVPTIAESGVPGYVASAWFGAVAPARTPAAIIARLNAEFVNVMNAQNVRDFLLQQGLEAGSGTPEQFDAFVKSERLKWAEVIRLLGTKIK